MEKEYIPRKRNLTENDLIELERLIKETHVCRFNDVTCDEMAFMKDFISMYKETRSEILKWFVKGIITLVGVIVLIGIYFKFGDKFK